MATLDKTMATRTATNSRVSGYLERFTPSQRAQHLVLLVSVFALFITGLPQKYNSVGFSQWLIGILGGVDVVRFVHRIFGIILAATGLYHGLEVSYQVLLKKQNASMLPNLKDAIDTVGSLRYALGVTQKRPRYGRYSFRQKFEYWGIVFGGIMMVFTGVVLFYPTIVARYLPGEIIPLAKVAHSYEALLAFLTIIIWHMYGAHFGPGKFPFDSTMFTGKMRADLLREEHPLEYERLTGRPAEEEETEGAAGRPSTQASAHIVKKEG